MGRYVRLETSASYTKAYQILRSCCIDKTSTAEVGEAINSMFRWYGDASVCYKYLADVSSTHELSSSRWFKRSWTLQELIAPKVLRFYSSDWNYLGSKHDLQDQISEITGIDRVVLSTGVFDQISIARRMSWASKRQTTRVEDWSYSLMGIFDVNMPLLYGEGIKSVLRLQEEIMKISDDHTLFAWILPKELKHMKDLSIDKSWQNTGLLANSPADFASSHEVQEALDVRYLDTIPRIVIGQRISTFYVPSMSFNKGVRIELHTLTIELDLKYIVLPCTIPGYHDYCLGVPIFYVGRDLQEHYFMI